MWRVEEALEVFPEIPTKRQEKGRALSGGHQQVLAVAQGPMQRRRLLMLDEPSARLSPVLVDRVLGLVRTRKAQGTVVLLVEQLIEKTCAVSDRVVAMARGHLVLEACADRPDLPHRLELACFGQEFPSALHG